MGIETVVIRSRKRTLKLEDGSRRIASYLLCCDQTRGGGCFFYLKYHLQHWKEKDLVKEEMAVSDEVGGDLVNAVDVFKRVTRLSPIMPASGWAGLVRDHLPRPFEARDLILGAGE